ncbi:MAG: hypothetical protein CMD66_08135 [Gammaproteobacteria bacterium]|nr:hypothetical protein [Gammaproteobacteria bacterium]
MKSCTSVHWFKIFARFLRLGCTSFGGPLAHIGIFRREFVEKDKLMIDEDYASLVALCQVIPGPTSSQLGMGLGFNLGGIKGAIAAWSGFTLPSVIIMVVAALWVLQGGSLSAGWLIAAMKIVAVGVVTHALLGMWYQLCTDRETKITALIAAITFYVFPVALTQVALIGVALVIGLSLKGTDEDQAFNFDRSKSHVVGIVSLVIWIVLMSTAVFFQSDSQWIMLLTGNVLSGGLVFGGGHVVLPFLEAEFVPPIDITSFLAGYGVAQAVPGPLFSFAAFIGTVLLPESLGWAALVAVMAIFFPGMVLLVAAMSVGQPMIGLKQQLMFVNAVVVGLLLAVLVNPIFTQSVYSGFTTCLALLSLLVTVFFKRSPLELVFVITITSYAGHLAGYL